jgi:hypothetical protein
MLSLDPPASSDSPSLLHELGKRDPSLSGAIDRVSLHQAMQGTASCLQKDLWSL